VILRHEVGIVWPDGRREIRGINVVSYGDAGGYSAMSKTVGYPAAIAAKMVLDGKSKIQHELDQAIININMNFRGNPDSRKCAAVHSRHLLAHVEPLEIGGSASHGAIHLALIKSYQIKL